MENFIFYAVPIISTYWKLVILLCSFCNYLWEKCENGGILLISFFKLLSFRPEATDDQSTKPDLVWFIFLILALIDLLIYRLTYESTSFCT